MKLYNEDGEEVEAFTSEEVDAKITEATKGMSSAEDVTKLQEQIDTITKERDEANTKVSDLEKKNESLSKSYDEAKTKIKENKDTFKNAEEERKNVYDKLVDDAIKARSGEDKELAEALKERYDGRSYETTISPEDINKRMDEELLLTQHQLNRDIKPFTPSTNVGNPPKPKPANTEGTVSDEDVADALAVSGMDVSTEA